MQNDPKEEVGRLVQFQKNTVQEEFLSSLNSFLEHFDAATASFDSDDPALYIAGVPRSGTTLLSQLLCRYLSVGYINNVIARFWTNPVVGIKLSQTLLEVESPSRIRLDSIHGTTEDPWGPHEFGYFWRHWLRVDNSPSHHISDELAAQIDHEGLGRMLSNIVGAFGRPTIFTNLVCGLNARLLNRVRPNSVFILIERNEEAVVRSILRCRKERYGDERVWWSLRPSSYAEIKQVVDPEEQASRQVTELRSEINKELNAADCQVIRLSYEGLCADPRGSLEQIKAQINTRGSLVHSRNLPDCPATLSKAQLP
jgi:hypothetical protein